jgi:hypothetical protein
MKRILLLLLLFPGYLFAQKDTVLSLNVLATEPSTEVAPALTWKDRREPLLAGFLSYLVPGAGQLYNKEYEKSLGVVAVMAFSLVMMNQALEVGNDQMVFASGMGFAGTYVYSFVDAILSAKKINSSIEMQLTRHTSLSLKPDVQLSKKVGMYGATTMEPILGLRLKLSL